MPWCAIIHSLGIESAKALEGKSMILQGPGRPAEQTGVRHDGEQDSGELTDSSEGMFEAVWVVGSG
jgi:hypothetical protein